MALHTMPWNPEKYHQFQSERSAPFDDLLKLVTPRPGIRAIDLGCGTGELTRKLADALSDSVVMGLDSSPQMLEKTHVHQSENLSFQLGDQAQISGSWDLIFSNAALQWSENHTDLIASLYQHLKPGGQIAVQVPSNHTHISHRLIIETAKQEPFQHQLDGYIRVSPVLEIDQYAHLLFNLGAKDIVVFEKVYAHVLKDADAVIEWISGTALVPYFERLGHQKDAFLKQLRMKLFAEMPNSPVFYPFKRTFFSAFKPG